MERYENDLVLQRNKSACLSYSEENLLNLKYSVQNGTSYVNKYGSVLWNVLTKLVNWLVTKNPLSSLRSFMNMLPWQLYCVAKTTKIDGSLQFVVHTKKSVAMHFLVCW